MRNWSVNEEDFKKNDPEGYERWHLEQLINYGLKNEKMSAAALRRHWQHLVLDPARRRFLNLLLTGRVNLN